MRTQPDDVLIAGRYRVVGRLGSGGMASVVLAEDERLGRRVAVKRFRGGGEEDGLRRFNREARVGASLNHPNIVAIYDTFVDDDGVAIVMEYVEGGTLQEALRRGPLALGQALDVVGSVAAALDHAHAHRVVHRDVKPANVLLGPRGTVKLADLGIATVTGGTMLTTEGTVLGTASYMAPEQLDGRRAGPEADVYALAAVAFEALSGLPARTGGSPIEIAHRVTHDPPPDLRTAWADAPVAVAALLSRGMAHDPEARPASAVTLAGDLRACLEHTDSSPSELDEDPTTAVSALKAEGPRHPAQIYPRRRPLAAPGADNSVRTGPERGHLDSHRGRAMVAAATAVAIALAVVFFAAGSNEDAADRAPDGRQAAHDDAVRAGRRDPPAARPPAEGADPAKGAVLNERGKALIDSGTPGEAIPILRRAVSSFAEGRDDINYAYALFNLGNALRLDGQPAEAVPVLERRLAIPDQTEIVQAELGAARAAASDGG